MDIELDINILLWADKNKSDLLEDIIKVATLEALLQVCEKYKLDNTALLALRKHYGPIPLTIKACEKYIRSKKAQAL